MHFNGLMLSLIIFFISQTSFAKLPDDNFLDGADSSGGGVAVVCRNTDTTIKSVELLDLYEGRIVYKLKPKSQGKDFQEGLDNITKKLNTIFGDLKLKKSPSQYIKKAIQDMNLLQGDVSIAPVNDANVIVIPDNCNLEQLAYYKNNAILLINSKLWNAMDEMNQAALIVHEAVYLYQRELGDKTSQYSRKVVAHLFSDYPFESLMAAVPKTANECIAHDKNNVGDVAFKFYKFINPNNSQEEVLQFTKFRGKFPYSITRVFTPLWPWPKEEGDLYLDVEAPIELYDQLYIRKNTGGSGHYYFDEISGDYQIKCSQSLDTQVSPAILQFNSSGGWDFGLVAVGGIDQATIVVTNTGASAATQMSATLQTAATIFSFTGGSYPGTGGTCAATLSVSSSCTINLDYRPQAQGVYSGDLILSYNDGNDLAQASLKLSGVGNFPALLSISGGPTYNYGSKAVGSITHHSFTVTNSGQTSALELSGNGLAAPFNFVGGLYPGTGGTCGVSLAAAASCTIVVGFAPISTGLHGDSIDISYFNGATTNTTTRSLQGTGVSPALLTISDSDPYDFGGVTVGGHQAHTFTLTNTGTSTATALNGGGLAAPFSFASGAFPGDGGTCGSSLAAGSSCTFVVRYSPVTSAAHSDVVDIKYFSGVQTVTSSRSITGVGFAPALLSISDGPIYDFGLVGLDERHQKTFVITNSGAATATQMQEVGLAAPFYLEKGTPPWTSGTCGTSLAAGASCTIVIGFYPSGLGAFSDSISLEYNNGATVTQSTRDIQGTGGIPATLKFNAPNILNIGVVVIGKADTFYISVENTGGVSANSIVSAGSLAAPFSFAGDKFPGVGGTCSKTLAAGASCRVAITFAPQSAGDFSETLAISYNDGASKQVVLQYIEASGKK